MQKVHLTLDCVQTQHFALGDLARDPGLRPSQFQFLFGLLDFAGPVSAVVWNNFPKVFECHEETYPTVLQLLPLFDTQFLPLVHTHLWICQALFPGANISWAHYSLTL